ncbi:hypothetical protein B0H11DRAFT_1907066 [Mycena galericulata]|nr:hypothetical protein B0H11DRAFT_1907066 [Mycena galericulata]
MSTKTESPVNRFPNAHDRNEDLAAAVGGAPLPDTHHTSPGLPANALSKNREELTTRLSSTRETPRGSVDPRHVTRASSTKACVHSSDYFERSSRLQLLRIKSVWRRLALSFFFLLLLTQLPILAMFDAVLNSVATAITSDNVKLTLAFIAGVSCILLVIFLRGGVYTPLAMIRFAIKKFEALWQEWSDIESAQERPFEEDSDMAETGAKIHLICKKLQKQLRDLKKAGTLEKLGKLHWGARAIITYYKQYRSLAASMEDFKTAAPSRTITPRPFIRVARLPADGPGPV